MKAKIFNVLMAVMLMLASATAITSCSSDDDNADESVYYSLGFTGLSISGTDEELATVMSYTKEVEQAYWKMLGLDSEGTAIKVGDADKLDADMKSKFNNTQLPAAPEVKSSYSFTVQLTSNRMYDSKWVVVASKTFAN